MAKPRDRVQLNKQESVAGGGDAADADDGFLNTCPIEPNEDAPEMQGVYLQPPSPSTARDEEVYISRDASGNMCFRDAVTGAEFSLTQLTAAANFDLLLVDDVNCGILIDDVTGNVLTNE